MNQEQKELLAKVGFEKFFELQVEKAVLSDGYADIEDFAKNRLINVPAPLSEVDVLKIDLEFSKFDLMVVQNELNETKQKLASVQFSPAPVLDITMFNAMMEQFNSIHTKLETNINPKELAKEALKEVLNPAKTGQKLTKAEQMKLDADAKTASANLKLIQKHAKKGK